jgi:hypothetical protein
MGFGLAWQRSFLSSTPPRPTLNDRIPDAVRLGSARIRTLGVFEKRLSGIFTITPRLDLRSSIGGSEEMAREQAADAGRSAITGSKHIILPNP